MKYRLDIDGLRAIAVTIVISFHLGFSSFSGGHIGVDVFFVLSGFLITSIISSQIKTNSFSLSDFYLRRINRLFPVLYATVFFTLLAGSFILFPDDFERLSRSAVATVLSVSNILFWSESGYWDVDSISKPLLHTWSLGVEEQFYLIWPGVLLLSYKFFKKQLPVLIAITAVSGLLSYAYSQYDLSGAFYLLPARIFQFSSGASLALLLMKYKNLPFLATSFNRNMLFILGLISILGATTVLDETTPYPGYYALIPTLGCIFILLAGSSSAGQATIGKLILENKVAVWLGRISYSLYLVHWPIIVFYSYTNSDALSFTDVAILVSAMLIIGSIFHYGIEKKFYRHRFSPNSNNPTPKKTSRVLVATIASGLGIVIFSSYAWFNDGLPGRLDSVQYTAADIKISAAGRFKLYSKACYTHQWATNQKCRSKDEQTILFLGNSHEPDGFNFMSAAYPEQMSSANVVNFGTTSVCHDLAFEENRWSSSNDDCDGRLVGLFNPEFIAELDTIILSSHHTFLPWNDKPWKMVDDIKTVNPDIQVIVIGDYLETKIPCVRVVNDTGWEKNCFGGENIAYSASQVISQELYIQYSRLITTYIDQLELLCRNSDFSSCKSRSESGEPFSFDKHHKTFEFSAMAGRLYAKKNPGLLD